jgi:hypothetical protein
MPFQGVNILVCKNPKGVALGYIMIPFQGIYSANAQDSENLPFP